VKFLGLYINNLKAQKCSIILIADCLACLKMASSMASAGGSGDDEGSQNLNNGRKNSYKRLTSSQTARLER